MQAAIKVKNLEKSFRNEKIFENVSLEIERGSICGFIGYNGSGKSVFFKLLCGLLIPDSGSIEIFDKLLHKDMDFPEETGIVIEHPGFLTDKTGFKNLQYLASIRKVINDEQIKESMQLVGLEPNNKKKVRNYSVGMKQRLAIAQAIMENPKILILDEPMNGLDKERVKHIRELILSLKSKGTTILISSHNMEDIKILCDRVYELENKNLTLVESVAI